MILTKQETQAAIAELQILTDWKLSRIAKHADLHPATVIRLYNGQSIPSESTCEKLDALLRRMRRRHVNRSKK